MSKLNRATQKQFGSSAPTSDVGQYGSEAAGSPVTSKDPAVIQGLTKFLDGWASAVQTIGSQPDVQALEDVNALDFLIFYQLCYIFQAGIPEWDSGTTYYQNSYCQVTGTIYRSLTDNNLGNNPSTNPASWSNVQSATPLGYLYGLVPSNDSIDPTDGIHFTTGSAKDSNGQYTMNPAAMTKKVNSTWAAGNNSGGLDTGTIGSLPVKVYLFSVGKSTDFTAGDFLMSKSITPNMTLPNGAGFDIYRLVGQRYWTGTQFAQFRTVGNGVNRMVYLFNTIHVLSAGAAVIFTDVSVSNYVDGSISSLIDINVLALGSNGGSDTQVYARPKGGTDSIGPSTTVCVLQTGQAAKEINQIFQIPIDTSADFQYAVSGIPVDIYLRGYQENL